MEGNRRSVLARLRRGLRDPGRRIALEILALVVLLRVLEPGIVEVAQLRGFDLLQNLFPRQPVTREVAIVDLDEASLAAIGQWPWPRTEIAKLITKLDGLGARVIAFDALFAEPDRLSPSRVAEAVPGLDAAIRAALARYPDNEAAMAAAMRSARVVLGEAAQVQNPGIVRDAAPAASAVLLGGDPRPFLFHLPALVPPIPALAEAARGRGLITILPEADGVVRRVPTALAVGDNIHPALAVEALRVRAGEPSYAIRTSRAGIEGVIAGPHVIPTDARGRLWVRYAPHRAEIYVPAKDVLADAVAPERLRDKIVLIGTSATGLHDLRASPLDAVLPGVEVHAQILETILDGTFLRRPGWVAGAEVVLIVALGLIMVVVVPMTGARRAFLILLALAGLTGGSTIYAFAASGLMLDGIVPLATAALLYSALVYSNYRREEQERQRIRAAFGQYLSPTVVDQLARDPAKLTLGGEVRTMSFLFCDIRGFTAIAEQLRSSPRDLTRLINRFLTPMTGAILGHGGTIDKYIGDCIMAFWNAPLDDSAHATHACEAALAMLAALDALNAELRAEAPPDPAAMALQLEIGIGINSGECIVGNMGSAQRFDYSVLGDAVNLAARLESRSRDYGVSVLLGESTQAGARDIAALELDLVTVKGKREPSRIYGLLGGRDLLMSPGFQALRARHDAMLAAYRRQDWQRARALIAENRTLHRGLDALYDLYLARIAAFESAPPEPDWRGVAIARSK